MFISGAKAKEELAANSRVVGANGKIKVLFNGGELQASSGVDEINLPDIPANAKIDNTKMRELRGIADHESFHCRYTPLDKWAEIARYCSASGDGMSMSILNGAEDVRIERLGMKEFPGTRRNLQATVDRATDIQAEAAINTPMEDWVGFMPLVLTWLGRGDNGIDIVLPSMLSKFQDKFDGFGLAELYQPDSFDELLERMANHLHDVWKLPALRNYLDGVKPDKKDEEESNCDGRFGNEKGGEQEPQFGNNQPDGKEDTTPSQTQSPDGQAIQDMSDQKYGAPGNNVPSIDLSQVADEIACDFPYFGDQDKIFYEKVEPLLNSENPMEWANVYGLGEGLVQALKDRLTKRNSSGRKLNLLDNKRLVNAYNREEKIWRNKKEWERGYNTAVSFVVDWSSSMCGRRHEMLAITSSLARGISQVGIPLEVTGFTEEHHYSARSKPHCVRSGNLMIYHAKGFDDPLDHRRIAGLINMQMGFTPDTEALQLAVERIDKRIDKRKIVIILTDGSSQSANAGKLTYRGKVIENRRKVYVKHRESILEQAEKDGIEVYAIALGSHSMSAYKQGRVLQVPDMGQLEARIFRMFFDVIGRRGN